MLKFFEPHSKVQKNREIMRETDWRMAKYGRRGLISNFFVFCLCLFSSDIFVHQQPQLAIVLSVGLMFTTLIRGYFLFRIDAIYPRAPTAWRNWYFVSTLLGAAWWSVIVSSVTIVHGLTAEAPLIWLYTVVFFSITAHAFAPFKRFLGMYQFVGIVPAALSPLFVGDILGIFYSAILLMFYWILHHHSELMGDTHWGHLEANYHLTRKAETLEEEKRDTRASVRLSNEYLQRLTRDLTALKNENQEDWKALAVIQHNLDQFYQVLTKEVNPAARIFNVRHLVQTLVKQHEDVAEKKGIELETVIAPAMPSRLVGDPDLLAQIVNSILAFVVAEAKSNYVFVEMEFAREYETSGQLLINVDCQLETSKKRLFQGNADAELDPGLDLILAKGLAEIIEGSLEVGDPMGHANRCITLRSRMRVAELSPRLDYHRVEYKNKPVLLVHSNPRWLDLKRQELDTLGFDVAAVNDFKKATAKLMQAMNQGAEIEAVVYSVVAGSEEAIEFANELLSHNELKYLQQFAICSRLGKKYFQDRLITTASTVHTVAKPSGLFEFEMAFSQVFCNVSTAVGDSRTEAAVIRTVLLVSAGRGSAKKALSDVTYMEIFTADDKKQLLKHLQERTFELVLLDCELAQVAPMVDMVRDYELANTLPNLLPIVAIDDNTQPLDFLLAGVDQVISTDAIVMGTACELDYWLSGRHH